MLFNNIEDVLSCPLCGEGSVRFINNKAISSCCNNLFNVENDQIIIFDDYLSSISEVIARDNQAKEYLDHSKFPTQISRMQSWMFNIPKELLAGITLDLGCGTGPTTQMLLEIGTRNVLSVDFSINSLRINKDVCQNHTTKPIYILQDIRNIRFKKSSASVLVMADFLQHIIDNNEREKFLMNAFQSLIPGGYFFLSFFNVNIKNYFKNDISGSFASGAIKYERLNYKNVISSFPDDIVIDKIIPMNISHHAAFDRFLCSFPFSNLFSRMIIIQGRKISDAI